MDEMDLMKQMRDVPSLRPEAYDRARTVLNAAMAEPVTTVVRPKRKFSWPKVSVAALGAAAVAAAVVIGTTGGGVPAGTLDAAPQVVDSPLVKLATEVQLSGAKTGDSSLIISSKFAKDGSPYTVYTVYTDKGQTFFGQTPKDVSDAARKGHDLASPYDAKVMAAARLAAKGDVEKAKIDMVNASNWGLGLSAAEQDKLWAQGQAEKAKSVVEGGGPALAPKPRPTGKELEKAINNTLWSSATYALFIGAANVDVRAGVLKLLATMPDVTVGKAEVDGQAALTLTAGPGIQSGSGGSHVVTVSAGNGLPIRSEVVPANSKFSVATYKSSRVNLADVIAGKV